MFQSVPVDKIDFMSMKEMLWPVVAIIFIIYAIMNERSKVKKTLREETKELVATSEKNSENDHKTIKNLETAFTVLTTELYASKEILRITQEKYDKLRDDYLRVEEALDRCRDKIKEAERDGI